MSQATFVEACCHARDASCVSLVMSVTNGDVVIFGATFPLVACHGTCSCKQQSIPPVRTQGGNARYNFRHNFLAGAVLNLGEVLGEVKHNVLSGQVMTFGWGTDGSVADNVISNPHPITHHSNKNKGWCVWSLSRSKLTADLS